jgi:hypothetical protein
LTGTTRSLPSSRTHSIRSPFWMPMAWGRSAYADYGCENSGAVVGNPHARFDEGRGPGLCRAPPVYSTMQWLHRLDR